MNHHLSLIIFIMIQCGAEKAIGASSLLLEYMKSHGKMISMNDGLISLCQTINTVSLGIGFILLLSLLAYGVHEYKEKQKAGSWQISQNDIIVITCLIIAIGFATTDWLPDIIFNS